ncbi:MAG: CopG domain protein DNA-binding domain protein [Verrucomicrobia bacterium]|nr:CopG domain protein DNA-binding domain protein [Verrucomicrobiota bacterium]
MAPRSSKASAPLTFDLPETLIEKIHSIRKGRSLKTASEVVRLAIEQFDFDACRPDHEPRQQISVRVSAQQRATLKRYAKGKDASVGELIRCALEDLPVKQPRPSRR